MNEKEYCIHKGKEETKAYKVGFEKWYLCEIRFIKNCSIYIFSLQKNKDEKRHGKFVLERADNDWVEDLNQD